VAFVVEEQLEHVDAVLLVVGDDDAKRARAGYGQRIRHSAADSKRLSMMRSHVVENTTEERRMPRYAVSGITPTMRLFS
jgi:hypothetical protein